MVAGKKIRPWRVEQDEDPLGGLINLFDLWIVVIVALMLMLVQVSGSNQRSNVAQGTDGDQIPEEQIVKLERFRESPSELSGRGVRLGIAYRLENGEVVYASEGDKQTDPQGQR